MKTKLQFLRWLMMLMLSMSALGAWAQPYPNQGDDAVCLNTTKHYAVIKTTGSIYTWSITTISGGAGNIIAGQGSEDITVTWTNPGTCTLRFVETNSSNCTGPNNDITVTINPLPAATISYASPFCTSIATPQAVTHTGTTGGVYTTLPAGLNIDAATGAIIPSTSAAGTYAVTYTMAAAGGCGVVTATTSVTVTALPTATISYSGSPWCTSATAQTVTLTGTGAYTGGTYSSTTGLTIDPSTGAITPGTSTAGTYTVTYTTVAANGCGVVTATTLVTVTALPTATISYSGSPWCTSATAQTVTLTGTGAYTGGTYSSTPGLTIDPATGAITPGTSTPGTYTVIYTTVAANGCGVVTATATITITALPVTSPIYHN